MTNIKMLVAVTFIFVCFSCVQDGNSRENKLTLEDKIEAQNVHKAVNFVPDSSINNDLLLQNASSTIDVLGDVMVEIDKDVDYPDVYFKSKGDEYLRVIFFPGNESNSLSQFEVGSIVDLKIDRLIPIDYSSFKTESGIQLGITKENLVKIKGNIFDRKEVNGYEVISYRIDDYASSSFLKRYNMPIYFAEYWFTKDNQLDKFKFGFEYP
jgi:hypothetical protein